MFIALSQSGRSPDLLASVAAAKTAGATILALCNSADAPLMAAADLVIELRAGIETSVAATKSYLATLAALIRRATEGGSWHVKVSLCRTAMILLDQGQADVWAKKSVPPPEVLRRFARHYRTGATMPEELLQRLIAARNFNKGFTTLEYISSAVVDLDFHSLPAPPEVDATAFESKSLARLEMPDEIAMRHRSPHFDHIFAGGGYAAAYYSYMWSEVLDADAFAAFEETGDIFDPATARRLRDTIYSAGGSQDPADLARKLEILIENPELRQRFGIAGRRRFEEHYTWPGIIERHYRPLLSGFRTRSS